MSYHYYIVYELRQQNGQNISGIMGNLDVRLEKKITHFQDLILISEKIAKNIGIENRPIITFYKLLREE